MELITRETQAHLERVIAERLGGVTHIKDVAPLSGGAIQENWVINIKSEGGILEGIRELVLRKNSLSRIPLSRPRGEEFLLLRTAYKSNVKVPRPYFYCSDPSIVGSPFFLMEKVDGLAAGHALARQPVNENLVRELGRNLARIHAIPYESVELSFLQKLQNTHTLETIFEYRQQLDLLPDAHPILEWGLSWLERNAPGNQNIVLCHRDYRTGNLMIDGTRLSGVLDWEFAGLSAPEEDLGWFCAKCWRFGAIEREAGGLGSRRAFYGGYESETGVSIDSDIVFYWEIMAHVRWAVIALHQANRFVSGGERNLELALTAHVVPELELEIMRMTGTC
ncbi:MAG: phosphotransferase family protein [Magnetovibrio sp.]|nr:phosphotransferase family protein [Magnetovibrio sp.]